MDQKKKVDWTVLSLTAAAFSDWFLFGMTKEIQSETQLMCQSLSECGSETGRGRTRRLDALLSERSLEEHAQDWAKTFALGAQSTTPHESVFRSGLVMQESRDQTLAWMRSMGLGRAEGVNEPEDHAGFQLAIFANLCARVAADMNDQENKSNALRFAQEHLLWLEELQRALQRNGAPSYSCAAMDLLVSVLGDVIDND